MGSIANKRGSVRQAPPQVYAPFLSSRDDYNVGRECEKIGKDFGLLLLIALILHGIWTVWRGIRSVL